MEIKEYGEEIEPEHILQDAMSSCQDFKNVESVVILIAGNDGKGESTMSIFQSGENATKIWMMEILKAGILNSKL